MKTLKNISKIALYASLTLASVSLWAQTPAVSPAEPVQAVQKPIKPYTANPNIFHVWAYKAQEGVTHTAEKVGAATERGVAKIKPSVDQAWDNTKDLAGNTVQKVDAGAQKATQNINTKIQETKEAMGRTPSQPVPIIQGNLSQSSSTSTVTTPAAQTPSSFSPAPVEEEIKVTRL